VIFFPVLILADAAAMAHATDTINVLIIGDDRFLVELVVANLEPLTTDVIMLGESAQTHLTHLVGTTPWLIISDRPFVTDAKRRIFHLPFPFHAKILHAMVERLVPAAESVSMSSSGEITVRADDVY